MMQKVGRWSKKAENHSTCRQSSECLYALRSPSLVWIRASVTHRTVPGFRMLPLSGTRRAEPQGNKGTL